jgi:CDP-glucose 4,6-dehydratase
LEPLSGYLILAQKLYQDGAVYGDAWNFGPNDEDAKPVCWIADNLTNTWGSGTSWVMDVATHPHEAHYLKLDCSKAISRLDWRPRWRLKVALSAIVDWHRWHQAGKDMRDKTLEQIAGYQGTSFE